MDSKSAVCTAKNVKDAKQTRYIARIIPFVRNDEHWKMHKIDWCEGGLQLTDIVTKNISDNDWITWIKYIMVRLDNWYRPLVQDGWHNTG